MIAFLLAATMVVTATACRSTNATNETAAIDNAEETADDTASGDSGEDNISSDVAETGYKIGIITGTVSQGEEEFRQAEKMKELYGDKIVTATYPDNFSNETETTISNVKSLADDPDVKVIVFVQAVPGASAAIDKVRETREDVLFICGVPGEDPGVIASKADIVLQADELSMGRTIVEQAKEMGATTIVHYSFPRHMSYALLAARRDLLRENSEAAGLIFVDATAPDPTGDSGVAGAQQFILEDVPRKVSEYGRDTVFFSTNCSMQEPLIKKVLEEQAMMVQQCCPSPYHGYPGALGIKIPSENQGDLNYIVEQISAKVVEGGNAGRMGTWPVPVNMMMVEAGVKYGIKYCEGQTNGRLDDTVLREVMAEIAGEEYQTYISTYDENGTKLDNFYMILCDYLIFE